MAEFRPREFYYHACEARKSNAERLQLPLHYYLRRGDLVAFRRALRSGAASPTLTDEYGKTILDVCLEEIENLLITGLCTSFPIDDFLVTSTGLPRQKSKFYREDENELWAGLYDQHERSLYMSLKDGDINIAREIDDSGQRRYQICAHKGYRPSQLYPGRIRAGAMIADDEAAGSQKSGESEAEMCANAVLQAVSESLSNPLSSRVRLKLQRMIRKLRVYLGVCEELCSCEELVELTMSRRQKLNELTGDQNRGLVLQSMRLPFLYICTMRLLLELYPAAPDGVRWRPTSPLDMRILSGLVCRLELPGHYLLLFLSEYAMGMAKLLLTLPAQQPSSADSNASSAQLLFQCRTDVYQYLLQMSFVLDIAELFDILCASKSRASILESIFDWQGTLKDLQSGTQNETISRYVELLEQVIH